MQLRIHVNETAWKSRSQPCFFRSAGDRTVVIDAAELSLKVEEEEVVVEELVKYPEGILFGSQTIIGTDLSIGTCHGLVSSVRYKNGRFGEKKTSCSTSELLPLVLLGPDVSPAGVLDLARVEEGDEDDLGGRFIKTLAPPHWTSRSSSCFLIDFWAAAPNSP